MVLDIHRQQSIQVLLQKGMCFKIDHYFSQSVKPCALPSLVSVYMLLYQYLHHFI